MNLKQRNTLRKFLRMDEAYLVSYKGSDEDFCCRHCFEKRKFFFLETVISGEYDIYIHGPEYGFAYGEDWEEVEYPRLCSCSCPRW